MTVVEPGTLSTRKSRPLYSWQMDLLTVSAADYAENQEKRLSEYELISLQATHDWDSSAATKLQKSALEKKCEAVVDVRRSVETGRSSTFFSDGSFAKYTYMGTGLRLKR